MRTVGVVSVGRSDYNLYRPIIRQILSDGALSLHLIVSGTHLSPEFGRTVNAIEADGFEIADRVEMLLSSDTPESISKSMGLGTIGFAQSYARRRPDILLVLGDRFEMHCAVVAAVPFKIPLAHIHGGEMTLGAIDDALRHSITKLSHLHFVSTEEYARRVRQMGEESWRVIVSGAPSLDNLHQMKLMRPRELESEFGVELSRPPLLVTFHPVTLEYENSEAQIGQLLDALRQFDLPIVFTMPNADTGGRIIGEHIQRFAEGNRSVSMVSNFGLRGYFSMMRCAAAMVGNSSSGIVEAPAFHLPVVNIGSRQDGRIRANNVLDVRCERDEIVAGIRKALSPQFRASLKGIENPYGDGHAAESIVTRLKSVSLDRRLIVKRFRDLEAPA